MQPQDDQVLNRGHNPDNNAAPATTSLVVILSVLTFVFWCLMEVVFFVAQLMKGRRPNDTNSIVLTVEIGLAVFVIWIGQHHFARVAHLGGRIQLTGFQSVIVSLYVILISMFLGWSLGLFPVR